jgi:hypothetical protein
MKKVFLTGVSIFVLIILMAGCNNKEIKHVEKKDDIKIDPNSKVVNISIDTKEKGKPEEIKKVYRYTDGNAEEITNDGMKKKKNSKLIWKGVPEKYETVKDLLGDSILYEVKYKDGDIKKFERKIKYTKQG